MAASQEPKRPQSAYFLYVNATREQVQKELEAKSLLEVTKVQAERWKTMAETEKATYEKQAKDLKVQYEKDLAAYKEGGGVVGQARAEKRNAKKDKADKKAGKKSKKVVDADKPKAPAGGAFGVWVNEHRAEIMKSLPAGSKATAVLPVASARWKALSEQEKEPYQKKYEEKAEKYKKELQAWKDSKPEVVSGTPEKVAGKKRSEPGFEVATPPQKKAKGRGRKSVTTPCSDCQLDADVLKKASGLGLETALKNLAARKEMHGLSADKMLSVLRDSGGLVNKAKAALLGSAGA